MSEFNRLAENFSETARDQGSRQAAASLFDASFDERFYFTRDENVHDALKTLTDQGALPQVSFEYLNSGKSGGPTNFDVISAHVTDDDVIQKDELNEEIRLLDQNGATFSIALVREIKDNFDAVADLDGESGISESDYKKFINQQQEGVTDSLTSTVKAGDGFDRIAKRLYKELLGEEPSGADVLALSERIAELNGNDRQYSKGHIQPGQELKVMSKRELEKFLAERNS